MNDSLIFFIVLHAKTFYFYKKKSLKNILFIITVVIISCRPLFTVIDYVVNYEKIVTELCINRNRSELTCNGICYLKDEISKSAKEQQSKDKLPTAFKSLDLFIETNVLEVSSTTFFKNKNQIKDTFLDYSSLFYLQKIIQPPIKAIYFS